MHLPDSATVEDAIERSSLEKDLKVDQKELPPVDLSSLRYAQTLALAGPLHSDHTDVAGDKYKHLAKLQRLALTNRECGHTF
jgi:hypothetical protein